MHAVLREENSLTDLPNYPSNESNLPSFSSIQERSITIAKRAEAVREFGKAQWHLSIEIRGPFGLGSQEHKAVLDQMTSALFTILSFEDKRFFQSLSDESGCHSLDGYKMERSEEIIFTYADGVPGFRDFLMLSPVYESKLASFNKRCNKRSKK